MSVRVYVIKHVAIEVDDLEKARAFYQDLFSLELRTSGERRASFKAGEHRFFGLAEVKPRKPVSDAHFGFVVGNENQLAQVRDKVTKKSMPNPPAMTNSVEGPVLFCFCSAKY